jgi:hypothetical protein
MLMLFTQRYRFFLVLFFSLLITGIQAVHAQKTKAVQSDRELWLQYLDKIARPVLSNLAQDRLKETMPVVLSAKVDNADHRSKVAYLEAFGRTLCGIAPWLNGEGGNATEMALRNQYRQWSLKALANAVNPAAKDYMVWNGGQPLVDASFVAFALVRCPWLWEQSDTAVKRQVMEAFKITRNTVPVYSNWILFSGMIEAFFCKYGLAYDAVRIEYSVREFANHWYMGDGLFSDGQEFHLDYYNSIVIQPYLAAIVDIAVQKRGAYKWFAPQMLQVNQRYAEIQERHIHTDGSYPVLGRSIAYRGGVFHHLSDMALRKALPELLPPPQVRSALTAVLKKTMNAPQTFTASGWLNIGLHGHQPGLGEGYINTGSLYICSTVLVALGLPETDPFWSAPAAPWTSVKVWSGADVPADHALDIQLKK